MVGLGGLRQRKTIVTSANQAATIFTGAISVNNASSLKSITVPKTMFKTTVPMNGWFVTYLTNASRAPITSISTSGNNYVLVYTVGTAFTGGLGGAVTVSTH